MMHPQIEKEGIVERYVCNQLPPRERMAFEEHFFGCDDCFAQLQEMERFVAGMRDAGQSGKLGPSAEAAASPARSWWMLPTLAATGCAAAVLGVLALRMYFVELPRFHRDLNQAQVELHAQMEARAVLEQQLGRNLQPEANAPLVMLAATRDLTSPPAEVTLPKNSQNLVLWIEAVGERASLFRVQITAESGGPVQTIEGLKRNAYGALSLSLPTKNLQAGTYRITLSAQEPAPGALLGEYRLKIFKL